jgi:hypothetical protein
MKKCFALSRIATVMALTFSLSAGAQSDFNHWNEFANWCRSTGGTPLQYPARCIPQSSQQNPPGPHLVWNEGNKLWYPEPGYTWVIDPPPPGDLRVRWVPGSSYEGHPNIVSAEEEGRWYPEPGYKWVIDPPSPGDFRVRWVPGKQSSVHPHVVSSESEGQWQPAPGYVWVNPPGDKDFDFNVSQVSSHSADPDVPSNGKTLTGTFITVACYKSDDGSAECSRNLDTAIDTLTDAMVEEAVSTASKKVLKVHFPSVVDRAEQIKLLFDLESKAIYLTQMKINADVKRLGVFSTRQPSFYEVQAEIARDAILLNNIHQEALEQANRGTNWDHNWKTGTHAFQSNAYEEASQIHFTGSFQ